MADWPWYWAVLAIAGGAFALLCVAIAWAVAAVMTHEIIADDLHGWGRARTADFVPFRGFGRWRTLLVFLGPLTFAVWALWWLLTNLLGPLLGWICFGLMELIYGRETDV